MVYVQPGLKRLQILIADAEMADSKTLFQCSILQMQCADLHDDPCT